MPVLGHGSTLGVDDGASGYDLIGDVQNFTFDAGTSDNIDVTNWDSVDGYEELIGGIKRGGNASFDTVANPTGVSATTNYDRIVALHASQAVKEWKWTLPTGAGSIEITFDAYVENYNISAPTNDAIRTSVTLRVSGNPTWPTSA